MKKVEFVITGKTGLQSGWRHEDVPGLAIAKIPIAEGAPKSQETWSVYHIESGRYVCEGTWPTRKAAEPVLLAVGALADWTQDKETVRSNVDLRSQVHATERAIRAESTP